MLWPFKGSSNTDLACFCGNNIPFSSHAVHEAFCGAACGAGKYPLCGDENHTRIIATDGKSLHLNDSN